MQWQVDLEQQSCNLNIIQIVDSIDFTFRVCVKDQTIILPVLIYQFNHPTVKYTRENNPSFPCLNDFTP